MVNFEKIDFDELVLVVVEKVSGELISEVVHITEVDQWSWIWELGFLQEVFHLFWVIVRGFSDDSLNLFVVSES